MNPTLAPSLPSLLPALEKTFSLAEQKINLLHQSWNPKNGTPVFTVNGRYSSRGWTEWTQGFQFGMPLLTFDATANKKMLELGGSQTLQHMLPHVTHTGVHDHGFNNISTYGNLRRLLREGRFPGDYWQEQTYATALKCSGAVQAMRWSGINASVPSSHSANATQLGHIYSFNGPHSLFVDTIRTTRSLSLAWQLGHVLMHENDKKASLLKRSVLHGLATSQYVVFHGDSSHSYDIPGRTAHEALFNRNDGNFRSRSTQQGYSPFSTWTRGLAWAILGFAEQLEFFRTISPSTFQSEVGLEKSAVLAVYENCARQTADHYIHDVTFADGIPYWDDGAPNIPHEINPATGRHVTNYQSSADPFNPHEPLDSSAAAIAAQGLLRLGNFLGKSQGKTYTQAALLIAQTLFAEPYLSTNPKHQGLILHSIYHRPNNWDYIPKGSTVPHGESSMWGDYHALELALLLHRAIKKQKYITFFDTP